MDRVKLGYISKPHGINGGAIFKPIDAESKTLKKGVKVYLTGEDDVDLLKEVQSISYGNNIIVHFLDVLDRNQTEHIVGKSVEVLKTLLLNKLDNDEFLLNDLIGFDVFDQRGKALGKVLDFSSNNVQDLIRVKNNSGKYLDLLLIQEFILDLDVGGKKIQLNVPEGSI